MTSLLEVNGLSKRYGGLQVVDDVSFEMSEGAIVALIGPNGAGKTTTMGAIAGSVTGWTGDIRLMGRSLRGMRPHAIARLGVARTFQVAQPFTRMRVVENVMVGAMYGRHERLGPDAARRNALALLGSLDLADRAEDPAESLNPTERKRLEIARALSMQPRLVLMDELLAGLNAAEVDMAIGLIARVRADGISILMVEHVMRAVAQLAERVIVLDVGRKIADGPTADVLADERVIAAYIGRPRFADGPRHPSGEHMRPASPVARRV